jgi:hypothetical protein
MGKMMSHSTFRKGLGIIPARLGEGQKEIDYQI